MSSHLAIAVAIADAVLLAAKQRRPLNVRDQTAILVRRHNVPALSADMIAVTLREEGEAAGVTVQ